MKKRLWIAVIAVLIVAAFTAMLFAGCDAIAKKPKAGDAEKATQIKSKQNDSFFRILQLTDLHLTHGSSYKRDKQTMDWVKESVLYARPDVVALTGDVVAGLAGNGRNNALIELANFFEEKEIYWMYTFGNHDGEWSSASGKQVGMTGGIEGRLELYELLKGYKYSLMQKGPDGVDGVGNYTVDVVDGDGNVVYAMVNMDTHGKKYDENGKDVGYLGLTGSQLKWYEDEIAALAARSSGGVAVKSGLFMHVPLVEYRSAWKETEHVGTFPAYNLERIPCAPEEDNNIGMFDLMKRLGSTNFVTVGHDHDFNWLREYQGVYFSYGRTSGVNAWKRRTPIGATVIDVNTRATGSSLAEMYKISVIEPTFDYLTYDGEY